MKIKLPLLLLLLLFAAKFSIAKEDSLTIKLTQAGDLYVNELHMNKKVKVQKLTSTLGEPDRKVDYPSGETSYFYDQIGAVFIAKDGNILGLGVNYHWDGDKKFPETEYTGQMEIVGLKITAQTKNEEIASHNQIQFNCIGNICASKHHEAGIRFLVGFQEEKITQVAFILQ